MDFPVDFSLGVVNFSVNLSVGERGVACDFFREFFFTIQTQRFILFFICKAQRPNRDRKSTKKIMGRVVLKKSLEKFTPESPGTPWKIHRQSSDNPLDNPRGHQNKSKPVRKQ